MESIEFQCPGCRKVVEFDRKLVGKPAYCGECGQKFIVPYSDFEEAQKLDSSDKSTEPPGFYRELLVDNWKVFFHRESLVGIVFITTIVVFKFFTGHTDYSFSLRFFRVQAPLGLVVSVVGWGCLLWYYLEIIYSAAFGDEWLPVVDMGGIFGAIWKIIKSIFLFAFAVLIVEAPFLIAMAVFKSAGISSELLTEILTLMGAYFLPMGILVIALGQIEQLLRPLRIIGSVFKAFAGYSLVAVLFLLIWRAEFQTVGYEEAAGGGNAAVALHLFANLAVQFIAVFVMRGIGLFGKHYEDYLPGTSENG